MKFRAAFTWGKVLGTTLRGRGRAALVSESSMQAKWARLERCAVPDSGGAPPTSPKRNLEGGGEPEAVRQRLDEGTTEVEERPEKFIAVGEPSSTVRRVIAARSVKKIEPFCSTG